MSGSSDSRARRVQYAALPYRQRQDGEVQVRLITSRETRRWVIPKGWPMKGLAPHKAAAREAFEEAGLLGSTSRTAVGMYTYDKRLSPQRSVTCDVMVFPLRVKRYLKNWPERSQRIGFWFTIESAAAAVQEEELRELILAFGVLMAERFAEKQAAKAAGAAAGAANPGHDAAPAAEVAPPVGSVMPGKGKGKGTAAKAKAGKSSAAVKAGGAAVPPVIDAPQGVASDPAALRSGNGQSDEAGSQKPKAQKAKSQKPKPQKIKAKDLAADASNAAPAPSEATGGSAVGKKKAKRAPEGVTLH